MFSEFAGSSISQGLSLAQNLQSLVKKWFEENGDPAERLSWSELKGLLPLKDTSAAFWDDFFSCLPLESAFLLSMTVAASETSVREAFLKRACKIAAFLPPEYLVATLKLFPKNLVLAGFGPAMLEPKPLGPLAIYVLGELGITISPGDVPAVLEAGHSLDTFENLAKLVPKEHYLLVKDLLETTFTDTSEDIHSRAKEFFGNIKNAAIEHCVAFSTSPSKVERLTFICSE